MSDLSKVGNHQGAGKGLLALPAPVNAHDHGYGIRSLDFGCQDDALEPWIAGMRLRPPTDPYLEALVAFGRLASNGCAATMHCHNSLRADRLADEVTEVVRAAKVCGICLAFSCPLLDSSPWVYGEMEGLRRFVAEADWPAFESRVPTYLPAQIQIEAVVDCIHRFADDPVSIQLGPIGPQWCSNHLLERIAETSEALNCRIHMHLLESPRQRRWLDQRFPEGIVAFLDRIGFLSPRLAVAHGVQLRREECDLLAERGVIVVSNPSANLRLRSGLAPVRDFRSAGLAYALGLDGTGIGDDQDIWQEMRLFWLLHSGNEVDRPIPCGELFDAVTSRGAEVLEYGLKPISSLVVVDRGEMTADAMFDDFDDAELVLSRMAGRHVRDLFVGGRAVVRDGNLTGFDFAAARSELVAQARAFAASAAAEREFSQKLRDAIREFYRSGDRG